MLNRMGPEFDWRGRGDLRTERGEGWFGRSKLNRCCVEQKRFLTLKSMGIIQNGGGKADEKGTGKTETFFPEKTGRFSGRNGRV